MIFIAGGTLAALFALALTPCVSTLARRFGALDRPGTRSVHTRPVPRVGGVAVVLSATLALLAIVAVGSVRPSLLAAEQQYSPALVGTALVFMIGLWDDLRESPALTKIAIETIAGALVIGCGIRIDDITLFGRTYALGVLSVPTTLLWILAVTNAFNLVDGLDGLAGGLAVIAATTCATILFARGHEPEALTLFALLGALLGFLVYNFHPASIFLGDSGSLTIGFVLATTAITGWQKGATVFAVGAPALTFALPISDLIASVARRLWRPSPQSGAIGSLARVLQADQGHIHHRLVAAGLSHRATVLTLYTIAAVLSGLALLTFQVP